MKTPVVALCLCGLTSIAASAQELSKVEAATIMGFIGCGQPQVAAVINGAGTLPAGMMGAPIAVSTPKSAHVLVHCTRSGKAAIEQYSLFHDADLGWFMYELDSDKKRIRLWNKKGYSQVAARAEDKAAEVQRARAALEALAPLRQELDTITKSGAGGMAGVMRAREITEKIQAAERALREAEAK